MKKILYFLLLNVVQSHAQFYPWWTSVQSGITGDIWGIDFVNSDIVWICADNGQVARSTNSGITWISAGNVGAAANSIAAISDSVAIIAQGSFVGDGRIIRTSDGGATWVSVYTSAGVWFDFVDNISSTLLWALSDPTNWTYFHIVKSTDGGITWSLATNLPILPANNVWGSPNAFYRIGNTCWWGTSGGLGATFANRIYKSTNCPDGPWTFSTVSNQNVYSLAFNSVEGDGIASSYTLSNTLDLSSDGGLNWFLQNTFFTPPRGIDYLPNSPKAWAATSTGIFSTTNNGVTWTHDLVETNLYAIKLFGSYFQALAGGKDGKLYRRPPLPVELISFKGEVSNNSITINWITVTETNNRGFEIERKITGNKFSVIGFVEGHGTTTEEHSYSFTDKNVTRGKYIYRLKQMDFDGSFTHSNEIEVEITLPLKFELEQNFPNPFNPSTIIRFTIQQSVILSEAKNLLVTLKVYDVLGNEVAVLVDEYKPAGTYEVEFRIENGELSSGVYYYQLKAGDFIQTKKMILVK